MLASVAGMYRWEQPALVLLSVIIAGVAFLTGNILFALVIVAGFVLTTLVKWSAARHQETGRGIHPYLLGGTIWVLIGCWGVYVAVALYQRDRDEPAPWFFPVLCGVGAAGALVLGGATLYHWYRDRSSTGT